VYSHPAQQLKKKRWKLGVHKKHWFIIALKSSKALVVTSLIRSHSCQYLVMILCGFWLLVPFWVFFLLPLAINGNSCFQVSSFLSLCFFFFLDSWRKF
jgi:hypothetical protein